MRSSDVGTVLSLLGLVAYIVRLTTGNVVWLAVALFLLIVGQIILAVTAPATRSHSRVKARRRVEHPGRREPAD